METKGRRSLRASGATEAPAPPLKPVEAPPPANGASEIEPPKPAEMLVETGKSTETAVDLTAAVATAAPTPSIGALPPTPSTGSPPPAPKAAKPDFPGHFEGDAAAALAQSQAALARGLEALSAEMAGLALSGMNVLARTATELLAVKTLSDAIEVNAGFTCSSLETSGRRFRETFGARSKARCRDLSAALRPTRTGVEQGGSARRLRPQPGKGGRRIGPLFDLGQKGPDLTVDEIALGCPRRRARRAMAEV